MRLGRPGLTCQELVELVTDYHEGALSWRERRRFEAHLAGCDACPRYVEQMGATIKLTGRLEPERIDPQVRAELLVAFRNWKGPI